MKASDCFSAVQHLDILILREPWLWMELQVVCWPLHTQEFYSNLTERGPPWLHQHIWLYSLPLTKSIFSIISVQRGIKPITIRDGYEYLFISLMNHRGGSYFLFFSFSLLISLSVTAETGKIGHSKMGPNLLWCSSRDVGHHRAVFSFLLE